MALGFTVRFRPTLSSFLVLMNTLAVVSFGVSGAMTERSLTLDLVLLPAVLLGFFLATRLLPHINADWFRRGVILMVMAAALSAIASAVSGP